jgi:crotonobetainyl-CoA:carnitine CoA-transferase CaiB-like acyl-CoA transferase
MILGDETVAFMTTDLTLRPDNTAVRRAAELGRAADCDLGTGMWAVQGILAALYERWHTGQGRLVECSLFETAIGFSSWTRRSGSPTTWSRPAKPRAIVRTRLTSACRPRTAI